MSSAGKDKKNGEQTSSSSCQACNPGIVCALAFENIFGEQLLKKLKVEFMMKLTEMLK